MTLNDRDRKIAIALIPIVLIVGYWFLLLAPKRTEAGRLGAQLTQAESKRDDAQGRANKLESAKSTYATDYATVVRLGKAIPSVLDMPSLLVQLEHASQGTGIHFTKVRAGERAAAPPAPTPAPSGKAAPPTAAGGTPAKTGPGTAAESANNAAKTSDTKSQADGAQPAAAATTAAGGNASSSGVAGLDSAPLEFSFSGSFFDLADFFHSMKRFVSVANDRIRVEGRLMTIDGLTFDASTFPTVKAEVRATVYLAPKGEGATAGATAAGPSTTSTAAAPAAPPAPASAPVATTGGTR